jgi:tripartite-type tricarboxylate transporter receptor subunit TctC
LVTVPIFLFARKTMPAQDLNQLIAWPKANPNKASAGNSSSFTHLATAFFQKQTATQFTFVPYRGESTVLQDLVAGQIDLVFGFADRLPLLRAGTIRAYAVASDTCLSLALDIPTFGEMGIRVMLCATAALLVAIATVARSDSGPAYTHVLLPIGRATPGLASRVALPRPCSSL